MPRLYGSQDGCRYEQLGMHRWRAGSHKNTLETEARDSRVRVSRMKRDLISSLLVGVTILGVLATATLSFAHVQYMRKLRDLQVQTTIANRNSAMFQELAGRAVEYGKHNPSIFRILEEVGLKQPPRVPALSSPPK